MKKFIACICFLVISLVVVSQKSAVENSLLWRITGKGLEKPSYIFGTIHMICPDDLIWTDAMQNAFDKSGQLYLELPMADEGFQQKMMEKLMLTDEKALKDFFTDEQFQKLDLYFKDSLKMPLAMFSKMKPFGLMSFALIKQTDCAGKMPASYEQKLLVHASDRKIKVGGLETVDEQIKIFDDMPNDSVAKMVMATIEDVARNKSIFRQMITAYQKQDITALNSLITESPEYKAHLDGLLYNRNARWAVQIPAIATETPTFFAVGAGHLPGEKGVLQLLKRRGYKVEAVQ